MNDALKTAQSAAVMQLLNWIAIMDSKQLGKYEIEKNAIGYDSAVFQVSMSAAEAFGFEAHEISPYIHVPEAYEEMFYFAPWNKAQVIGNALTLFAGPPSDEHSSIRITLPLSAEALENLKQAKFICFAGPVDDDNSRFERKVMLVAPVSDDES